MTGLVVHSAMAGVAVNSPETVPLAASFALAIFQSARNENGRKFNSHAPPRRRRNHDRQILTSQKTNSSRKATQQAPASSSIGESAIHFYRRWMQLPQIFRFTVAGNLGNLGFFYLEKAIFRLLSHPVITTSMLSSFLLDGIEKFNDTISFFSAYVIQIVTTHLLYAWLVYGMDTIDTSEKYWKTLVGQFKVYGFGLFGATFLNSYLIRSVGLDKTVSILVTMGSFAVLNYFLVSWVVKKALESST